MANENDINFNIKTTADPKEVKNLGSELKQVGDVAEKSAKKATEAQKEELGLLQRLEKQLKELKEAREKSNSEKEIAELNKQIREAEENLDRLNKVEPNKGFRDQIRGLSNDLGDLPGPAGDAASSIQNIGAVANPATLLVAALAAAIVATFKASKDSAFGLAENAKEIENLKNVTGVATLTAVTFAQAIKAQGGDVADVTDIFNQLAGVVSEIKAGNKDLADAFKGFGIEDFSNLDTVVTQLAKNLSTLPKDINTVANASKILGEEGVRQFSAIAPEIDKYSKLVQELGLANEETLKKGRELNQAVAESAIAFEALQNTIGGQTAPAFTEITKSVKDFILELAKSETAKKFFKDFSEGLLEVVKLAVSTKNALKDLLDIIDPLVQKFTGFNNTLELISKNSLPGTITEISRLINTYVLGDRALEQQIKKQKEYEEQLKQVTNTTIAGVKQQQDSIAAVKNQIDELSKSTRQLLENEKIASQQRIQQLEEQQLNGAINERELLIETSQIKQDLANQEVVLATETRNKIDELVKEGYDLKEELVDAEIALNQALLASDSQRIENIRALQNLTAKELREQIESNKKDRQDAISQELSDIAELENQKVVLRQEAAKQKREILLQEIEQQISDERSLIDNSEIGQTAREEARKRLSDLISKQAEIDKQTEKAVQDAIVKDTQDAANQRIAEEKRVSDEAKKEADKRSALIDQQKAVDKSAFEQRIAGLKQAGATAEQIALATANFEIEQQQRIITLIKEKIAIQAKISTDSTEIVRLNTQLIEAETRLNQLGNSRIELLNKQKAIISEINTAQASGNEQFAKALQQHIASVEKLGDRANSVAGNIKGGIVAIGESFDFSGKKTEELISQIQQIEESIKFIREVAVIPDKDVFINAQLDVITKLNEEVVNRTQRAQLQAQAERARQEEQAARERAAKELEIEREKEEKLREAREERKEQLLDIQEDIDEENERFADREKDRAEKLAEDKTKAEENFRKREEELAEEAERREIERVERLKQLKEDTALDTEDKLNQILRDNLTKRAQLQAQIEAENDPKKKQALQDQLANLTKEGNAKEEREKRKQAEIEKLLSENLSEEELKARKEAIERRFDLEEEADEQRQELIKSGNQKALAEFDKLVEEQKKRDEERLAKELERIKEQAKRKEEQAKKEREQRQAELDQRLKDLQDNYDKEKSDEEKRHQDRLAQLQKQQDEIKKQYKETVGKIVEENRKAQEALVVAANSAGEAFASSFDKGIEKAEKFNKLLDETQNKLNNIGNNSGDQSSSTSNNNSSSSSSPNNPPSNPSNNPFSSPNQGDNNGSAGSIGFNRQAANNQGNQSNQSNQQGQNNNSPSSPPASPSNNQANPSSNAGNTGISASNNQANQNSQSQDQAPPPPNDPDQQGGDGDGNTGVDGFGRPKLASEYHKASTDLYISFKEKAKGLKPKKFDELVAKHYDAALALANTYTIETFKGLSNTDENGVILTSESFYQEGYSKALQSIFNGLQEKNSIKYYAFGVNKIIEFVEYTRKRLKPLPNKNGLGSGLNDKPPTIDSNNPGDVNSPNGSGRGNNPSPRGPGSAPTPTAKPSNPGGLSDKEKAFFAGRDKDANTGFDEAEASGLARRKGLRPDAAVGGGGNAGNDNEAQDPSLTSNNNSPDPGASQPQNQTINQTNNSPVTVNLNVQGFLGDRKTLEQLEALFGSAMQQKQDQDQQKLRNLMGSALLR